MSDGGDIFTERDVVGALLLLGAVWLWLWLNS